jgi:hypothetical protein
MLSDDQVQQLKEDNEQLRLQLREVNELLAVREEELALLRSRTGKAAELQSKLENTLLEMDYLQHELGRQQQLYAGATRREANLEKEMLLSLQMEKEFLVIRDKFKSTRASLHELELEVQESAKLYKQIADLQTRIAEMDSELSLIRLDNGFLKEELLELRKRYQEDHPEENKPETTPA